MNQKMKLLGIGSLILALLSLSENAFACVCWLTRPPCEEYWQADAVFIGTPKELSWFEYEDKLPELVIKRKQPVFHFSVDQAFRGVNGSQVAVLTGMGGGDCGYGFKKGVVLWPDGKPAPNAQLICYMHGGRMCSPIKIDEQGHFSFKIYEGVDAFLVAEIETEKGKWMRGELKAAEKGDLFGAKLILAPRKDN